MHYDEPRDGIFPGAAIGMSTFDLTLIKYESRSSSFEDCRRDAIRTVLHLACWMHGDRCGFFGSRGVTSNEYLLSLLFACTAYFDLSA